MKTTEFLCAYRARPYLAGASTAVMAALLLPTAVLAQSAQAPTTSPGPERASSLDDVIVTARRASENLQEVPVAVTVLSAEALERKNISNIVDVARYTPGFTTVQSPRNATALALTIRGQVQNDTLATVEPSVGLYVDEVYWARAYGLTAAILDPASVQILKGPQGTLFGRNTSGGALVVTTKDPNFDGFSGRATAGFGRFNETIEELTLNVPINDHIALRGAFRINERDGWQHGVELRDPVTGLRDTKNSATSVFADTGQTFSNRDEIQARVKALIKFDDANQLLLSGEWWNYETRGYTRQGTYKVQLNNPASDNLAVVSPVNRYIDYLRSHPDAVAVDAHDCSYAVIQPGTNCSSSLVDSFSLYTQVDTETYSAKFTHDMSFGQAKLIAGYRRIYSDGTTDIDGTAVIMHTPTQSQSLKQWSIEGQLNGSLFSDVFDYAMGLTYFHEDGYDYAVSFSNANGNKRNNGTRQWGDINNDSIGVYAQGSYHLNDRLTLTGGLRYSEDDKGFVIRAANVNLGGVPVGLAPGAYVAGTLTDPCNASGSGTISGATPANDCSVATDAKFDAVSWTASADYKITSDILGYLKASRGYRSGGHNFGAFNNAQFRPFQPEYVNEYELGLKSDFFANRLRVNLAVYRNYLADAQRTSVINTGGATNTIVNNAAKAETTGAEFDIIARVTDALTLSASGSVTDPKYTEYADATGDRTNERFAYVPDSQFSVSAEYYAQFGDDMTGIFNLDYSWVSEMASDRCNVGVTACYKGTPDMNGKTTEQVNADWVAATTIPSAGLLSARATFGFNADQYRLAFWGRNLTDNRDYSGAFGVIAPMRNYVSGIRREPRTYGVTFTANF